ncbi:MAG TPA: lamin tail domain-containing protein, partial [Thermoplasmata archaeon]|nr:lamin tail domain-containing protein [Thermoplasmata archaeon]
RAIAAAGADVESAVAERRLLVIEVGVQQGMGQTRRGQVIACPPSGLATAVRGAIAEIGNHAPKRAVLQQPRIPMSPGERDALLGLVDNLRDAGYDVLYEVDSESHRLLPSAQLQQRFPVVMELDRRGENARLRVREARGVEVGEREADLRLSPDGTLFIATGLEIGDVRQAGMVGERVRLAKRGLVNGGMVNGLVNGKGAVNGSGLTNGKSILQKRGLVNGRGLINGGGLTNGRVLRYGSAIEKRVKPKDRSWMVTVLAIALVIGGPAVFIIFPGDSIVIDGEFSDWSGKTPFDPNSALIDNFLFYHDKSGSNKLFIYMQGAGTLFGGGSQDANSIFAFFASGNKEVYNGYQQNGFPVHPQGWNAQYMVAIHGGGGRIASAAFYIYAGPGGQEDWSSWDGPYDMKAANYGSELEAQLYAAPLGLPNPLGYSGTLVARNAKITDISYIVSPGLPGALDLVPSYRESNVVNGSTEVLDVAMTADGHDVTLEEIRFDVVNGSGGAESILSASLSVEGVVVATSLPQDGQLVFPTNISVPENHRKSVTLAIDSAGDTGKTVSLRLAGAVADQAVPTARMGNLRYWYMGHVPAGLEIDGGFDDWSGRNRTLDTTGDVERFASGPTMGSGNTVPAENPNVDVAATALVRAGSELTLFSEAGSGGLMLGGSVVLGGLVEAGFGGASGPAVPPPLTPQEDRWYFFLDTDARSDSGYQVGGIGAELTVNVSGSFSEISSAKVERYTGSNPGEWKWEELIDGIDAKSDSRRLEARASIAGLGTGVRVAVMAMDWEYQFDVASASLLKADEPVVNAPADVVLNEVCPGSTGSCGNWIELYNKGSGSESLSGWTIVIFDGDSFENLGSVSLSGSISAGGYAVFTAAFTIPQNAIVRLVRSDSSRDQTNCITSAGSSCARTPDGSGSWSGEQSPTQGSANASEFPFGVTAALVGAMVMAPLASMRKVRGRRIAPTSVIRGAWTRFRLLN